MRRLTDQEGQRLQQIVRRGSTLSHQNDATVKINAHADTTLAPVTALCTTAVSAGREREESRTGWVVVKRSLARTALSHRICTGISRRRLGALIAEL
ncbi:hypothetical protein ACWD27_40480, partial [Streptomyces sp. NPDC002758]